MNLIKNKYGDVRTEAEFVEDCLDGMLTDYDGYGYWAIEDGSYDRNQQIYPSIICTNTPIRKLRKYRKPEWATHVVWFNR